MADQMHREPPNAVATSTISGKDAQLDVLTRLCVGLLRQMAHDANKGKPVTNTLEIDRYGMGSIDPRRETIERVAEQGRAIVRQEFFTDADAARYALKWSILPDDLPDRSARAGDAELTVHPIDASRFQEIVRPR